MTTQSDQLVTLVAQIKADVASLGTNLTAASAANTQALNDLKAAIAAGNPDISQQLADLTAADIAIQAAAQAAVDLGGANTAADPGAPAAPGTGQGTGTAPVPDVANNAGTSS